MDTGLEHLFNVAEELAQLGSWQQDLRTGDTVWSPGTYRILGLAPDAVARDRSLVMAVMHPEDRERMEAVMAEVSRTRGETPLVDREFEFRVVRPDGALRYIRSYGRVERDEHGRPLRWTGIALDVTDQRLSEAELLALYGVSQALRDWETFEEGVVDLLRRMATALGYPLACLWVWDDEREAIVCRAFWSEPDVAPEPFETAKRGKAYKPGQGKPGKVWAEQRPIVIPDIEESDLFDLHREARETGVRSCLTFPAVGPEGTVAVLSFYAFEPREPSPSLVRTLTAIGQELGRFLYRRRGQLGHDPLSARELEVLQLAGEGRSGPRIAEELFISPTTVKTHFEHIYDKLGVSDRPAAVAHALRIGLIR
jgi:PAS domain S-box-containing protein